MSLLKVILNPLNEVDKKPLRCKHTLRAGDSSC